MNINLFKFENKKKFKGSSSIDYLNENISFNYNYEDHIIKINPDSIHSLFVICGSLIYNDSTIEKGTFIKVDDISEINFKVLESVKIFEIISPKEPSYKTYSSMRY